MAGGADDQENPDNNQNPQNPPIQTPQALHSVSIVKLLTLKKDTNGIIRVLPPKFAEDFLAIERERKARTTLLIALLEDHLYGFYNISDAKEMWDAIKSRFQKLLSQLEVHGAGLDTLSFDDLYNNLRVFESDVKGSGGSSSSAHNVAFVGSECTTSTNKQAEPKALAAVDGESIDWNDHAEDDADDCAFTAQVEENFDDFALMAFISDNEVKTCTKESEQKYANLKKLFDAQKDQITDYIIEVKAYDQALKSVEAQLACHQKNQLI
ncbi:hypothetical protein Tco_1432368, partial [Tanacetum coccineum]